MVPWEQLALELDQASPPLYRGLKGVSLVVAAFGLAPSGQPYIAR
jgi:hypothetical protein